MHTSRLIQLDNELADESSVGAYSHQQLLLEFRVLDRRMAALNLSKFGLQLFKKKFNFKGEFVLYMLLSLVNLDGALGLLPE